ncbi:PREDICTED: uncharacterized protein LOC101311500 [Fragaria vesca subsp. vesca]
MGFLIDFASFLLPWMWPALTQKAKDGGLDMIQTYVFWDGQDPSPGKVTGWGTDWFIQIAEGFGTRIFIEDLTRLDNQFQTFTEVFELVVSGFEAAKDVYGQNIQNRFCGSAFCNRASSGRFKLKLLQNQFLCLSSWNQGIGSLGGLFQGVFGFWLSARHGEKANE